MLAVGICTTELLRRVRSESAFFRISASSCVSPWKEEEEIVYAYFLDFLNSRYFIYYARSRIKLFLGITLPHGIEGISSYRLA